MCNVLKVSLFALTEFRLLFHTIWLKVVVVFWRKENDQSSTRKGMKIQLKIITTLTIYIFQKFHEGSSVVNFSTRWSTRI
jgi:hypothetical protein